MPMKKTALVLATFGTKHDQEEDFVTNMQRALETRCPGTDVFIAFTSKLVSQERRKKGQAGNALAQILSELSASGYTHVAVQSLHVVPGLEFDMLKDITARFADMPKGIRKTGAGFPLIHDDQSAERLAGALLSSLPATRKPEEAVVFVGHGSHTPSGTLAYPALQAFLWQKDPNVFVGTVEGALTPEKILDQVKAKGASTVWLNPLLAFYGTHVMEDIFGEGKSWQTLFAQNGITCVPIHETLLARPEAVAMWTDNAVQTLEDLTAE
ncbi:MAG: Sirohydrochlorin cobaltochelatase CbiKP [Desulfovibrio sp.]